MSEPGAPWWYSGDEPAGESAPSESPTPSPTMDWTVLAAGAQRLVDWATEKVMAPHAEHDDPRAHPQCMVCRALLVIGERPASPAGPAPDEADPAADGIAWIRIVADDDAS